ncbi:MAG: 3-oxoacyl-[acyl-carrier-protein] synthase-3 [Planctomycetota bacterium]|jgi:3-oxoacyl-[acyl-carrier-protein] synthase-3
MSLIRNSMRGIGIAGAARVFPEDLIGPAASLDSRGAAAVLFGDGWENKVILSGFDLERAGQRSGVEKRGWTKGHDVGALELAVAAGNKALDEAGWTRAELNAVVVATCTPPRITSNFAAQVASGLSTSAAGIDVRAGDAGGLEAWVVGANIVRSGGAKVLVIAAEANSHYANRDDLGNALLLGDGAGALALEPSESNGGLVTALSGTAEVSGTPFTVTGPLPPTESSVGSESYHFQRPDAAYRLGLGAVWTRVGQDLVRQLAELEAPAQHLLPHSVTLAQLEATSEPFGLDVVDARLQLENHGCLGCAGPIALVAKHWLAREDRAAQKVMASLAVGDGVSWCALAWLG